MINPKALLAVLACAASSSTALGFVQPFSIQGREAALWVAFRAPGIALAPGAGGRRHCGALGLRSELLSNFKTAVKQLHNLDEWNEVKEASRLVILKLGSSHCRKCHACLPKFQQVAEQYQGDLEFAMVHLDKVRGMVQETGVKKTPTFHVYKDGEKVDELVGSGDVATVATQVRQLVEQWRAAVAEKKAEGARDVMLKHIVESYTPADGEEASPISPSVTEDSDLEVSGTECGDEGCEISWD